MSIMVGVGRGAQAGILIKNAEALERFAAIDTLIVDKTGTLTEGRPHLARIETVGGVDEDTLLRLAASLERGSEHPLAAAITAAAEARGLALTEAQDFAAALRKAAASSSAPRQCSPSTTSPPAISRRAPRFCAPRGRP
jgi:Cu+-exporting ATPase